MAYEKHLYYKLFFIFNCIKKKKKAIVCSAVWSRLIAVDTLVLLHPAPPQHLDVFGS